MARALREGIQDCSGLGTEVQTLTLLETKGPPPMVHPLPAPESPSGWTSHSKPWDLGSLLVADLQRGSIWCPVPPRLAHEDPRRLLGTRGVSWTGHCAQSPKGPSAGPHLGCATLDRALDCHTHCHLSGHWPKVTGQSLTGALDLEYTLWAAAPHACINPRPL